MDNNNYINELIIGFLTGEISTEERNTLIQWIESSEKHRHYFDEMIAVWQMTGSIRNISSFDSEKAWENFTQKHIEQNKFENEFTTKNPIFSRFGSLVRKAAAVVAAILLFVGGGLTTYYFLHKGVNPEIAANLSDWEYRLIVPRGAKSTMVLPDGTKVIINAAGKLTYAADYGLSSREVFLEGEAYFDVETNPEKPFTIHTSELDIRAYGTAFNVKAYPEDPMIVTTLEHGELKVNSRNDASFDMVLQPKQSVVYYKTKIDTKITEPDTPEKENPVNKPKEVMAVVSENVQTQLYTSWKDAEWLIESQTFGDLATLLERRYNIRIVFESNELEQYRFSGTIRNETIEQMLSALALTAPMKYNIGNGIVQLSIDLRRKHHYENLNNSSKSK